MTNTKKISRRKFTAEFKAKVAMEALQERMTLQELCKKYELHPNQITAWKEQLKENCAFLFQSSHSEKDVRDSQIEEMKKTIGELTMDINFLKKSFHYEYRRAQI